MCVCQMITFESFDVESSFLRIRYNLFGIQVEFVYEGHRVMVKVTGAKHVKNPYYLYVKLRVAITLVL